MTIKKFNEFVNENYKSDHAIEDVLYKAMGDSFLDNRDEILDNVYTILGMRIVSWAVNELIEEYPDLANYKDELIEAAKIEGYEDFG